MKRSLRATVIRGEIGDEPDNAVRYLSRFLNYSTEMQVRKFPPFCQNRSTFNYSDNTQIALRRKGSRCQRETLAHFAENVLIVLYCN